MGLPPSPRVKVVICGSVDDGKSTLVARLLLDSGAMDEGDAAKARSDPSGAELANVIDGLAAEREQAITIDVAYRYISTGDRSVMLIDCPGHEQYTRNMVTGASNADLAVVLVDASKGITEQTWRHSRIAHLLGIVEFVFAINKMDLVDEAETRFDELLAGINVLSQTIGLGHHNIVPVIATTGDMVVARGERLSWHHGRTLFETILGYAPPPAPSPSLRLPIQAVVRGGNGERWLAGNVVRGEIAVGDTITVLPGDTQAQVTAIAIGGDAVGSAATGRAVAVTLDRETDCGRGSLLCASDDAADVADQYEAEIAWLGDRPMLPGRACELVMAHQSVRATCQEPKFVRDVASGQKLAAKTLRKNDIGVAILTTARDIVADSYRDCRTTGGFILIDSDTNETIAAGMIRHALRRSFNIAWQELSVDREARAMQKGQKPFVLWFTGLSGAGKTTIANLVEQRLFDDGLHSFLLDGDNVRMGLNKDLGFTQADRIENIRRIGEVARLMTDAGLIVLSTFISPFRAERDIVRELVGEDAFIEVFVATPLDVAERRDPKGLYAKARRGDILNFTGIDSPYEEPENPAIRLDTTDMTPVEAAEQVVRYLRNRADVV